MSLGDFLDPPDLRARKAARRAERGHEPKEVGVGIVAASCGIYLLGAFVVPLLLIVLFRIPFGDSPPPDSKHTFLVHNATDAKIYIRAMVTEEDSGCRRVEEGLRFGPGEKWRLDPCYDPSYGERAKEGYLVVEAFEDEKGERKVFAREYTWSELEEASWQLTIDKLDR